MEITIEAKEPKLGENKELEKLIKKNGQKNMASKDVFLTNNPNDAEYFKRIHSLSTNHLIFNIYI